CAIRFTFMLLYFFFFKQKTAYDIGLGIPAEPLFRSEAKMGKVMRHTLGPLLEDKLCLIFKLAPSVCRMTFPILASLLVRLVVLRSEERRVGKEGRCRWSRCR